MQVPIIPIGNSKGIRLSKAILERYQITDKVELILEDGRIIIEPRTRSAREGWDAAFAAMHANGDDALLMDDVFEDDILD